VVSESEKKGRECLILGGGGHTPASLIYVETFWRSKVLENDYREVFSVRIPPPTESLVKLGSVQLLHS
jgi:hypothetical protein